MDYRFEIALSFAGDNKRNLVRNVAEILQEKIGNGKVFFDEWFESEIAGMDAHIVLKNIYGKESRLVVAWVCKRYQEKPWTQDEWRAIQDFERKLRDASADNCKRLRFYPLRFGEEDVEVLHSTTVATRVDNLSPSEIAKKIINRLQLYKNRTSNQKSIPYNHDEYYENSNSIFESYLNNERRKIEKGRKILKFRSLDYFETVDSKLFFGRENEIQSLISLIYNHKITVVSGQSGIGKSSFLAAGLFPELIKTNMNFIPFMIRVNSHSPLIEQIKDFFQGLLENKENLSDIKCLSGIYKVLEKYCGNKTILLILDQFEQAFNEETVHDIVIRDLIDFKDNTHIQGKLVLSIRDDKKYTVERQKHKIKYGQMILYPLEIDSAKISVIKMLEEIGENRFNEEFVDELLNEISKGSSEKEIYPISIQIIFSYLIQEKIYCKRNGLAIADLVDNATDMLFDGIDELGIYTLVSLIPNENEDKLTVELISQLIPHSIRNSIGSDSDKKIKEILEQLNGRHLIRIRHDSHHNKCYYELMHDHLMDLIKKKYPNECSNEDQVSIVIKKIGRLHSDYQFYNERDDIAWPALANHEIIIGLSVLHRFDKDQLHLILVNALVHGFKTKELRDKFEEKIIAYTMFSIFEKEKEYTKDVKKRAIELYNQKQIIGNEKYISKIVIYETDFCIQGELIKTLMNSKETLDQILYDLNCLKIDDTKNITSILSLTGIELLKNNNFKSYSELIEKIENQEYKKQFKKNLRSNYKLELLNDLKAGGIPVPFFCAIFGGLAGLISGIPKWNILNTYGPQLEISKSIVGSAIGGICWGGAFFISLIITKLIFLSKIKYLSPIIGMLSGLVVAYLIYTITSPPMDQKYFVMIIFMIFGGMWGFGLGIGYMKSLLTDISRKKIFFNYSLYGIFFSVLSIIICLICLKVDNQNFYLHLWGEAIIFSGGAIGVATGYYFISKE